jgi:hypothetical protein
VKITAEAVVSAMKRYRDFYALHYTADPMEWRKAVVALEQSLGIEPGASVCFLQLLEDIGPHFGDLQPTPMASAGSALSPASAPRPAPTRMRPGPSPPPTRRTNYWHERSGDDQSHK